MWAVLPPFWDSLLSPGGGGWWLGWRRASCQPQFRGVPVSTLISSNLDSASCSCPSPDVALGEGMAWGTPEDTQAQAGFHGGRFRPPGDIWQHLEMLLVFTLDGGDISLRLHHPTSCVPLPFKDTCEDIGPTRIIQDNLILRSAD